METTKNTLPPYARMFFDKLGNYLNTPLYFYGSVQRNDYFPNSSDIDVGIFTPNESSIITYMQNYLNIKKIKFKRFIYKLKNNLITGYKIQYKEPHNSLNIEFSIYNEKFKEEVLKHLLDKQTLPYMVSVFLIMIKYLYYKFNILPKKIYDSVKRFLLNNCIDGHDSEFVLLDLNYDDDDAN
jgi:hypothetical protein